SEDRGGLVALHFKIRDTGRGVPARILRGGLDGVTGPYDRLEPGDRLAVLSLRTTKQLVSMMDGELRVEQGGVEAGPDAGTSFDFTVLAEPLPGSVATTQLTLEAMRVLIVSADPTERRLLNLQVEQWDAHATSVAPDESVAALQVGRPYDIALVEHRPPYVDGLDISASLRNFRRPEQMPIVLIASSAPSGAEAVASVAQQSYDAVLMDVLMPEMDGLAAAEAICRRWPRGNRPRLIALTAMAGPGDQDRCLRAGFDDYMSKPVHLEALTEALN